jgi:hypothetical protein
MALLLLLVGIGSAVNKLPATEFTGNVDMDDNFIISVNKTAGLGVTVGFTTDCDYVADGTDDDVTVQAAADYLVTNGGGALILVGGRGTFDFQNSVTVDIGNSSGTSIEVLGIGRPRINMSGDGAAIIMKGSYNYTSRINETIYYPGGWNQFRPKVSGLEII